MQNNKKLCLGIIILLISIPFSTPAQEIINIGFNYPQTGPYSIQGFDQWRATMMAVEEINTSGGILGRKINIISKDSQSRPDVSTGNVTDMLTRDEVKMVFGGSSSAVAIASAKVCHRHNMPFFGTLTYSTATTGEQGLKTTFRECYDSYMAARALASYLKENFRGKKYFYITANYTWGWTTEASVRLMTTTENKDKHPGIKTPFPSAQPIDFEQALKVVEKAKPEVLVLVLFGSDMTTAVKMAYEMGLKDKMQIVVPNLTLGMAEGGGPEAMQGVIGALPWCWKVPYQFDFKRGQEFVENFVRKYDRYPSTSGASAYTILYEYKNAVERAGSFETNGVIKALEGHEYTFMKDRQYWRDFDHQSIQTVYMVKCKPAEEVKRDQYQLDYFEIISSLEGDKAAIRYKAWSANRKIQGRMSEL